MATGHYRLSPYCVCWMSADGSTAQVAHGLYGTRFEIAADLLGALIGLSAGGQLDDALAALPDGAAEAVPTLILEKILVPETDSAEWVASDPFRGRLDPLELAFHRGVNEGGYFPGAIDGATAPSVAKAARGGTTVALRSHDGDERNGDLARCLGRRRSLRGFGTRPLARAQLERFLELAARAYAMRESPGLGWVSVRNYPSAGARYPLEIYPVVYNVESLPEGIYHYRPFGHCLEAIGSNPEHREMLAEAARQRMAPEVRGRPAVLFVVTAVFARTCWKYRGMPYQAILMETGALYQTMYLAATMLGLAPCAVGAFPELATAQLLGVDSRDEAQVGLFALGVDDDRSPVEDITAMRQVDPSPFADGDIGDIVEITFGDGGKLIVPVTELALLRDDAGGLRCSFMRRGHVAIVSDRCRDDALRLLRMPDPTVR